MQIELKILYAIVMFWSILIGMNRWTDGHYLFENFFVSYNTLVAMD